MAEEAGAQLGGVYLFVIGKGPNAGQRMERNNVWRDFNAIRRKAGLPKCSMHDLRRSFCTNLSRAMPMHVVQELAGHSDIRTTRRFYVQVEPELMQRACRALEMALDEATETENGSD
ncbi:MAG: tyrosine-type recombinase/integrase [Phycisphaerae bacterium]|jgi:integrase